VVKETKWKYWRSLFERWHYLALGPMPFSTAFVGFVDGEPVAHVGMSAMVTGKGKREARACRLVILPEWQGAGIGTQFLEEVCERELRGEGFVGKPTTTMFHTNHPGMCFVLRRSKKWRQVSTHLHGASQAKVDESWGWGRHFRAVQGFRYYGQKGVDAYASADKS
jgi:GNAT superfamily N-acetyltransferase